MRTKVTTLPNKLKIITNEMPGARSITAMVMVGAGGRTEKFDKEGGVSHILEHMLFKGSVKRPSAKQISLEIDSVGGYTNAYTGNELTAYYIKLPRNKLALALDILSDIIIEPLLEQDELDKERGVIVEEINWRRHEDAGQLVGSLVPPLLWPDNPLGQDVAGNEEVIRTVGRKGVAGYKNKWYHPNNMVVSVAGGIKHDDVVRHVKELMGAMKARPVGRAKAVRPGLSDQKVSVYTKPTIQTNFIIGCRAYPYFHPDDAAVNVMTTILGNGPSSRLYLNVREQRGLVYDIGASRQNFVDSGMFEVYAMVNSEKTDEAIGAVLDEFELIQKELVPEDELIKAKEKIKGGLAMAMESNGNVADRFGTQLLLLGKVRSIDQAMARIDRVKAKDVQRVAQDLLAPHKLRMAMVAADGTSAKLKFEELTS